MRFLILIFFCFAFYAIQAQDTEEMVKWEVALNEQATAIEFHAGLQQGWVIYSQHTDPEGPIPLEFAFTETTGVELQGAVEELTLPIKEMSQMFDVEVIKFKNEAEFIQKLNGDSKAKSIKGTITYMTCNIVQGICFPPKTIEFQVSR